MTSKNQLQSDSEAKLELPNSVIRSFNSFGTVKISMEDFYNWLEENYAPDVSAEYQYWFGVPRLNKSDETIEIDFVKSIERSDNGDRKLYFDFSEKIKPLSRAVLSITRQWEELK